jgi:hypothetical protein
MSALCQPKADILLSYIHACCALHCAPRQILAANVRFGSKADIETRPSDVRFTPKSGHPSAHLLSAALDVQKAWD